MRLLKFFGILAVTAMAVFALVFGFNWKSYLIFMDNRDAMADGSEWVEKTYSLQGLTEFIEENPEYVSIASIVVDHPDSSLMIGSDIPRVMGTASNLLILLAYSVEFENGTISPSNRISIDDISLYQLPEVEESAHKNSFDTARSRGWLANGQISYSNALKLLAQFNDLALADFLLGNLRPEIWEEIRLRYNLIESDMPLPFSGLYLAIAPSVQDVPVDEILNRWNNRPQDEFRRHVQALSESFAGNTEERNRFSRALKKDRLGNTFMEERNAMFLFPKTTAGEIAELMLQLVNESKAGDPVSGRVIEWLNWPLEQQREIRRDFSDYGAMFDNRLGLLNGIDFGTSAYTGHTTVQAVFFDRLPIAFWLHMSSNHMHQDFQQRLIFDPAMIERMMEVAETVSGKPGISGLSHSKNDLSD